MLEDSIPRCLLLIVFIVVGGFFSGRETAFSFCNETRIRLLAEKGDKRAKRVIFLLDRFDETVVTLLVAINIIHVVSASIATMLVVSIMGPRGSIVATVIMRPLFLARPSPKTSPRPTAMPMCSGPPVLLHAVSIPLCPPPCFWLDWAAW